MDTDDRESLRYGLTCTAWCLGLGVVLTVWGLASAVIVPVDHLYRAWGHRGSR
jgi:hypothetical protein